MKNSHKQTFITLIVALLIIVSGFLSIRNYSEHLKNGTLNNEKNRKMNFKEDTSLEAEILDRPWEDEEWDDAEIIPLPIKYDAIVSEVCSIFEIPEKPDDRIYKKDEREFLVKYFVDEKWIYIYINENTSEFSFWIEETAYEDIEGNINEAVWELEEQEKDQESKLYKLTVDLSRSLSVNGFLTLGMYDESELKEPEYMKRDLIECQNTVFAHDDKVYSVMLPEYIFENNNFISLVYDSKTKKYCGCKFTIIDL